MNEFIDWIANNNTLMIKTGFTSILLLLVVYMYRFFFVPKLEIIESNEKSVVLDSKVTTEAASAVQKNISTASIPSGELKTVELEKLKSELSMALEDLKKSQAEVLSYKAKTALPELNDITTSETSVNNISDNAVVPPDLKLKIEQLEARLAEYEIIAEDISELAQLRQENLDLKNKKNTVEYSDVVQTENIVESVGVDLNTNAEADSVGLEANLGLDLEEPVAVQNSNEEIVEQKHNLFISEKEVGSFEIDLINQFEDVLSKKVNS